MNFPANLQQYSGFLFPFSFFLSISAHTKKAHPLRAGRGRAFPKTIVGRLWKLNKDKDKKLHKADDFCEKHPCIVAVVGGVFPVVNRLHPRADQDGEKVDEQTGNDRNFSRDPQIYSAENDGPQCIDVVG